MLRIYSIVFNIDKEREWRIRADISEYTTHFIVIERPLTYSHGVAACS